MSFEAACLGLAALGVPLAWSIGPKQLEQALSRDDLARVRAQLRLATPDGSMQGSLVELLGSIQSLPENHQKALLEILERGRWKERSLSFLIGFLASAAATLAITKLQSL